MKGIEGKVVLVTGGGKGLGRDIALALAARGARLIVTGREERALGETVGEIAYGGGKARHLAGDVRDRAHLSAAIDRAYDVFGGLDIVIANAGRSVCDDVPDDGARAETIFSTNLMGVYYTFSVALARMKGPGRLLAMSVRSAGPALADGGADRVALGASEAGVLGLVREMAPDLASKHITCNAIVSATVTKPHGVEVRPPSPESVVGLVLFLCSSSADDVTGQAIAVG